MKQLRFTPTGSFTKVSTHMATSIIAFLPIIVIALIVFVLFPNSIGLLVFYSKDKVKKSSSEFKSGLRGVNTAPKDTKGKKA